MSAKVFQLDKDKQSSVNQGTFGAEVGCKRPRYLIMTPPSYFITPAQYAAGLKSKLQADMLVDDPTQRIYTVGIFGEAKDNTAQPKPLSYAYGVDVYIYSGQYNFDLYPLTQDIFMLALMQAFNDREDDFLCMMVDEDFKIMGTKGDDGNGNVVFRGGTLSNYLAQDWAFDMGEGAKQVIKLGFANSKEFNKGNMMILKSGFNFKNLKNVTDVKLIPSAPIASRVVSIAPMTGEGEYGTNLAKYYPTILGGSGATALWKSYDHATGVALTATSAVKAIVDGIDVITLTWPTTNFPTSGGAIELWLDTPTNLATAGIKYFETPEPLIIPIP